MTLGNLVPVVSKRDPGIVLSQLGKFNGLDSGVLATNERYGHIGNASGTRALDYSHTSAQRAEETEFLCFTNSKEKLEL